MSDTPPPTPNVLADLERRRRQYPSGGDYFVDDFGSAILDDSIPGLPNAGAKAAAKWLQRTHPDLWGDAKPAVETKVAPTAPATATDIMRAVRAGQMTADAAHEALMTRAGASPVKSAAPRFNLTKTMLAARNGDAAALAYLNDYMKG